MEITLPLFAAFLPFMALPIEYFFAAPHIVEELFKAVLVYFMLDVESKKTKVILALSSGVMFAITEAVLYLYNIFAVGNTGSLILRLLLTIPLHSLTTLLILLPTFKSKKLLPLGFLVAAVVHYIYNYEILLHF